MVKVFHVLMGVLFLGLVMADYFYLILASRDHFLFRHALRFSFLIDLVLFSLILSLFATGAFLMHHSYFTAQTPWIRAAFFLLSLTLLCWLILVIIKLVNYFKINTGVVFCCRWLFHSCHVLLFIFVVMIVHDAVMKST